VDGKIPEVKQAEYKDTQVKSSLSHLSGSSEARSESSSGRLEMSSSSETFQNLRNKRLDLPLLPPISSDKDARNLVTYMKNAPNDRVRMSTLMALDRTPRHCLPSFLRSGGLPVLGKWIREHLQCRYACLTLLTQLPLEKKDISTVEAVVQTATQDARSEVQAKAAAVLDLWHNPEKLQASQALPAAGQLLETRLLEASIKRASSVENILESKRPKQSPGLSAQQVTPPPKVTMRPLVVRNIEQAPARQQSMVAPPQKKPVLVAATPEERSTTNVAATSPRETVLSIQTPVLPVEPSNPSVPLVSLDPEIVIEDSEPNLVDLPRELTNLHPRIQSVLGSNPRLVKLLQKHPEVMTNFHAGTINRLGTLLRRAQESEQLQLEIASDNVRSVSNIEAAACRTVIISRLPPDTTTSDVEALFDNCGPVEAELLIESRRKRHVGIAYVILMDAKTAVDAVQEINGCSFCPATNPQGTVTQIAAHLAVAPTGQEASGERVSWKASDELWQQHMFNPNASVIEGCRNEVAVDMRPASDAARAEFRDAARKEREEQAKLTAELMRGSDTAL
jgi:hypothetical protein